MTSALVSVANAKAEREQSARYVAATPTEAPVAELIRRRKAGEETLLSLTSSTVMGS